MNIPVKDWMSEILAHSSECAILNTSSGWIFHGRSDVRLQVYSTVELLCKERKVITKKWNVGNKIYAKTE